MRRKKPEAIRYADEGPLPPLVLYQRCRCGECQQCMENDRWDRIFARFAVQQYGEVKGLLQSTLRVL